MLINTTIENGFLSNQLQHVVVGVDGGGTKCRACVFTPEMQPIGYGVSGPANIARYSANAFESIQHSVKLALFDARIDWPQSSLKVDVYAGLAGYNVPSAKAELSAWQHPFSSLTATTDLSAALYGAHDGEDGSILLIGTGSCAASLCDGNVHQLGGHGFQLGDKGSGAWIGQQALTCVMLNVDGDHRPGFSEFASAMMQALQVNHGRQIVDQYCRAAPADFAKLAPQVFALARQGQPIALDIIKDGVQYLDSIAKQAIEISGGTLALVGGLSDSIRPWLSDELKQHIRPARHGAEKGAVLWGLASHQLNALAAG